MSEIKLQSEIAQKFSELFPERRGQLFHVSNERNNPIQAMQFKSIGGINGIPDFIYIEPSILSGNALRMKGIEVKAPGRRHSREHIETQLDWGINTLMRCGGQYAIVTSCEAAIAFILGQEHYEIFFPHQIKKILSQQGKTIKF